MGFGDELMAAGQAQVLYDADPQRRRVAIVDAHARVRRHEVWEGNPVIARPSEVAAGEPVQRLRNGVGCRPYIQYPFTVDGGLTCTDFRAADAPPRLYLTDAERASGAGLAAELGAYVVIEPALKPTSSPNKAWGLERYAALVAACPDLRFVRMVFAPDPAPLAGVTTIACASFREACGVLAHAAAYVGPEGGLHHACAALAVPAVVLFGGFISPRVTGYPQHVNLADEGPGSPCGRWRPCAHCAAAMARITPDQVAAALRCLLPAALMVTIDAVDQLSPQIEAIEAALAPPAPEDHA